MSGDNPVSGSSVGDSAADATTAGDQEKQETGQYEEIVRRLDDLSDLFVRRLSDDRARRVAVEELSEKLRQAELGPFRQYLHPLVHGLALVMDRLDRYDGPDPRFVASIREELLDLLARQGVHEVDGSGDFDPASQEAVEVRRDPDALPGTVLEIRRAGLAHGSWVFRPAQVVVNAEDSRDAPPTAPR